MKDSIGEKQVKVFTMKKFVIFIFSIFVLLIGMFAIMYNSYIKAYEEAHNNSSYSWTKETYPVEKYSTSSDGNKDDFESSKQEYVKKLFHPALVEKEFRRAYATAKQLSKDSPISKQAIKNKIKIYNYSDGANQYAVYKLNIDWKEQAVLAAKSLQRYRYSKEKLVWQLINVELFTQEEADYAAEQVHFDWRENAVKEAESYANGSKISKEKILEILVENRKFTQEEAEYAIEHAQVDWLN